MNSTERKLALASVLEPLCEATERTLRPLELGDQDHLVVSTNEDGDKFVLEVFTLQEVGEDRFRDLSPDRRLKDVDGRLWEKLWSYPSRDARGNWINRIPEHTPQGAGRWICAMTDFTCLVIHHAWPIDRLVFTEDLASDKYHYLILRFFAQSEAARRIADFKINKIVPALPEEYIPHEDLPLTGDQMTGVSVSLHQESYALFMEQGLGKTPTAINRICIEAKQKAAGKIHGVKPTIYRTLVLCPKNVQANWESEFRRFATAPGKVSVLRGGPINKQKILLELVRNEPDCVFSSAIMSIDSVSSILDFLKRIPWDLIIIDESQYIKEYRTKRFKCVRELVPCSRQRMILTGTPIANTPFDLWAQLEFLGEGMSGFSTFSQFRAFHGQFRKSQTPGGSPIQKLVGIKAAPLIQERLSRVAFMLTKKEGSLNLPDKVYDIEEVEMTSLQSKYYREVAEKLVLEIEAALEEAMEGGKTLTADHILTKLLRLAQITSGHIRWDDVVDPGTGETLKKGSVEQIDKTNPKVEAVIQALKGDGETEYDPNSKMIVWASFVEDLRVLSHRLAEKGIKHVGYHDVIHPDYRVRGAREASDSINLDPDCKVFLGNPASAGEGLTLIGYDREDPDKFDTYVDRVYYFSCNWSHLQRAQSEDRAHRRGTRMPVRYTDLVVPGTIDEEIRATVMQKRKTAAMLQDVRAILKRLVASVGRDD